MGHSCVDARGDYFLREVVFFIWIDIGAMKRKISLALKTIAYESFPLQSFSHTGSYKKLQPFFKDLSSVRIFQEAHSIFKDHLHFTHRTKMHIPSSF